MYALLSLLACGGGFVGLAVATALYYKNGLYWTYLPPSTWSDDDDDCDGYTLF